MGIEQTLGNLDPIGGETEGYITADDVKASFIQTYTDFETLLPDFEGEVTKTYVDTQDNLRLSKTGGTLTGNLTLAGNPSTNLHAATKQYADLKLPLTGGTLTGLLTLSGNPSSNLHAATKQYVDTGTTGVFTVFTGWVDFGTPYAGLYVSRSGPIVVVDGVIKPTANKAVVAGTSYQVGTVPAGFRPAHNVALPCSYSIAGTAITAGVIEYDTDGKVYLIAGASHTITTTGYVTIGATYRGE